MKHQKRLVMILLLKRNVCDQCLSLPLILFLSDGRINPLNVFKAIRNTVVDTTDGRRGRTTTRGDFKKRERISFNRKKKKKLNHEPLMTSLRRSLRQLPSARPRPHYGKRLSTRRHREGASLQERHGSSGAASLI